MFPSGTISYGTPNPGPPAPADMPASEQQGENKQPQGQGNTVDPLRMQEAQERARRMAPAVPYGYQGERGVDGYQARRMDQFPDWDGDLRWPPPQFMAQEATRANRLRALERQDEERDWVMGEMQIAQMNEARHEADLWKTRENR